MKTTTKLGVGEHINDEVDVVFVGVSGLGIIEVEGEEHGLDAGRMVFVPKGTRRSPWAGTAPDQPLRQRA